MNENAGDALEYRLNSHGPWIVIGICPSVADSVELNKSSPKMHACGSQLYYSR